METSETIHKEDYLQRKVFLSMKEFDANWKMHVIYNLWEVF